MEYAIHALAKLAHVSTRTLRYYDEIGLLRPVRTASGGCRIYGPREVDRLQQILFYRAMGVGLEEIARVLDAPDYDAAAALQRHLTSLNRQKAALEALIGTVDRTLRAMKGETEMKDFEKFDCFRQKLAEENEASYGAELRGRFGDAEIDAANARLTGMNEADWQETEALRRQYEDLLRAACAAGDPGCAAAQEACAVHGRWLQRFWKPGTYSRAAQLGLGEQYAADGRFAAYYEAVAPGCAVFFRDALRIYCAQQA